MKLQKIWTEDRGAAQSPVTRQIDHGHVSLDIKTTSPTWILPELNGQGATRLTPRQQRAVLFERCS